MSSDCYEFEEEIVTSMNTLHVRISGASTPVENPLECVCVFFLGSILWYTQSAHHP